MMRYKVGDRVRVKEDADQIHSNGLWVNSMNIFKGKEFEIIHVGNGYYNISDGPAYIGKWAYAEEWLELVSDIPIDVSEDDFNEIFK